MKVETVTLKTQLTASYNMTAYIADNYPEIDAHRQRPALLIMPGGGYRYLSNRESEAVALHFMARGFQCFVLHYSVTPAHFPVQLLEAAEAIATIRTRAEEWHVQPNAIFAMGFSAGGHLAASLGCYWNQPLLANYGYAAEAIRPDGLMLAYAVIRTADPTTQRCFTGLLGAEHLHDPQFTQPVSLEQHVTGDNPPTFIWTTLEDQRIDAMNSLIFAEQLAQHHVAYELHIFGHGPHALSVATADTVVKETGFGAGSDVGVWTEMFCKWAIHVTHA